MEWFKINFDDVFFNGLSNSEIGILVRYRCLCQQKKVDALTWEQVCFNFDSKELKIISKLVVISPEVDPEYIQSLSEVCPKLSSKNNASPIIYNLNNIHTRERKERKKINKKSFLSEFETWWAEYPNKKSKQDALRIFEKLLGENQVTFDELLAGAKAYAEHCRREKTEPHYIKHPSTWLNQGCWADEYKVSISTNDDDFYRKLEALQ